MIRQTFSENGDNEQSEPTTENNINNNTRKGEDKSKTSSVELVTASFPSQADQSRRMKNQTQDRRSEFNSQEQSSLLSSYQQPNAANIPKIDRNQQRASRLRSTTETRATAMINQQDNTLLSQSGTSSAQSKQYPKNRISYEVAAEDNNGQLNQQQARQSKLNRQIYSREDIDLQSGQIHLIDGQDGSIQQEQSKTQSRQSQNVRQNEQVYRQQYQERQSGLAGSKDKQKVRSISELQQSQLQINSGNNNNAIRQSLQLQDITRKQDNRQHQEWIEAKDNTLIQQEPRSNFKSNNNNNTQKQQQQYDDTLPMEVKGLRTKEKPMLTVGQNNGKYSYEDNSSPTRSVAQVNSQLSSPKVQFGTPTAPILQARSMALQSRNTLSSQSSNNSDFANKLSNKKHISGEDEEEKETNEQNSQQNIARPINDKELEERIRRGGQLKQELAAEMDPQETWSYFEKYQPVSNGIIDLKQLASSEFLRLKRYKQGYFYGEIQNLTKTGQGIMAYFTGKLYEGEWQNDTKFGRGFELQPNGSSYQGYFVNGKPEGYGEYIWNNGESYQGDWVNGLKHGQGTWLGQKGDSYCGEWKFGKADGKGKHTWVNGDVYEGDFKCCLKHGQGEERFANKDTYIGQYANGRPEGQGIYQWNQGAIYKGGFKNGLRHGKGIWMKNKDDEGSDSYEGDYLNDKRCGKGVFHWASGNIYKGEYFDDLRNGYGEMYWTDGSYYKGDWEKGVQCGEGELHIIGEGIKKGTFANNSLLLPAGAPENNQTKQPNNLEGLSRILPNIQTHDQQKLNQRQLPAMYQQRLLQDASSLEQLPSEDDQIYEQNMLAGQPVSQQQLAGYLPNNQSQEVQPKQWVQQFLQQPYHEQKQMQNDGSRIQTNEMPLLENQLQQQQQQRQQQQQQQQQQNPQQYLLAEQLQRKYEEEQQLRQRAEMQLEQELFLQRELQGLRQQQEKLNEQQLKQEQQLSRLLPRLQSRSSSSDTQSLLQSRNIFQNSTKTRQPLSTQQDDFCQTSLTPPSTQTDPIRQQLDNNSINNNNINNNTDGDQLLLLKQQELLQEQQLQQLMQVHQESQQMPFLANKRNSSVEKERESRGTQTVSTQDRSVSTEGQIKPKRENKGLVLPRLVPLSTKRSSHSGNRRHNNNNSNSVSPNRERDRNGYCSPSFNSNKPCLLRQQEIILWQSMRNKLGIPARELNDFSDPKTVEIIRSKIHPPIWKPTGVARFLEESPSKQILLSAVAASSVGQQNTKSS